MDVLVILDVCITLWRHQYNTVCRVFSKSLSWLLSVLLLLFIGPVLYYLF